MDDAFAQQVEAGAAVHLPLDGFKSRLTLPSVAPEL